MSPGKVEGIDRGPVFDNRYRVVGKLGEGGMAEVFHVLDEARGGQAMAYKLLKGQREHLDHFQREFEVLSRLSHPNLIQVFDFGLTDGDRSVYYTAEYVKGRDLFNATLELGHEHLFDLVVQIARGLTYIHARGLIHYDIKPENIVVRDTADGWPESGLPPAPDLVKIMDFGLTGEERSPGEARIKGTVHYLAPEIARGGSHDRRVDLYSLGISLYHCLARKLPYDGSSTFSVIRKHLEAVPEPPRVLNSTVPFAWEEFSLRLMAKDPAERPASASDALMELSSRLGRKPELDTKETLEGYLLSARFVAREAEMSLIRGLIEERSSDLVRRQQASQEQESARPPEGASGAVVLVAGEGGMGKTRLLDEARIFAQLRGVPFLLNECAAGGPPLATFSRIVHAVAALAGASSKAGRPAVKRGGKSSLDRLLAEEPALAALLGVESGWQEVTASQSGLAETQLAAPSQSQMDRDLALDRLAGALVEIALASPFVVAIEDLHFADPATLRMVEALVRNLEYRDETDERAGAGPVILLSYRPELVESGAPLEGLIGLITASDLGREIELAGIDEGSVSSLVGSMLAMPEVAPELVSEIRDRAGGNPQFVCELLRALIEDDAVRVREGPTPRLKESLVALGTPRSLADVVQKRLDRLGSAEERVTLEVLAVSFPALPLETLAEATGLEAKDVLDVVERLQRSGLVVQGSPTTKERDASSHYTPAHRTLRDGILAGLDPDRSCELHRVVGLAVEALARRRARPGSRYPVTPELLLDLSRHFELCEEASRCFVYAVAAADHAIRLYANEVAIDCLQRALSVASRWPDEPALLSHSSRRGGGFGQAPMDSSSDERPSLLEEAGMAGRRGWRQPGSQSSSRSRSGSRSGRQSAASSSAATLRQREPACRLRLGELLARVGRAGDAEKILGPLLQLRDQAGARKGGRDSVAGAKDRDEITDREPAGGVSIEFLAPRALRVLGSVRLRIGRLQSALEAFDGALEACGPRARRGSALGKRTSTKRSPRSSRGEDDLDRERVRSLVAIARVHLWRGDYARAVSVAEEARSFLGGRAEMRESLRVIGVLAVAEYHRGRYGRVSRLLRDCLDALRADERQARRFLRRLALPSVSEESFTEALLYLEARPRLCRTVSDSYGVTVSFSELGFLFDLRGSPDDAVLHYERSQRIYERLGDTQGVALALNNLGVLARIRGEYGSALEMLTGAQDLQRQVEDRQGEAATLLNLGLVRLVVGDLDRAEEELSGALDRTRALGLRWMAGFAQKALASLEAQLGRLDRCMGLLRRSEGLFRQVGNPRALGDVLLDHAERLIEVGRQDDALEMIDRARDSGEEEKGPDFLATAELLGGLISLERGQVREAMVQLDAAHSYVQEAGLVELEMKVEAVAGEVYEAAGRLRLAASHYDRAATLERRIWEGLPANLGESFFRAPARERLRRAKRRVSERLLEDDL